MRTNEEWASPEEFKNWHFAEVNIGRRRQVCSIFHSTTPIGVVPYWYDDPDYPQRALPLLKSMSPKNLGDYGTILKSEKNRSIFVALCKILDDLPDPLITVHCIQWIDQRRMFKENTDTILMVNNALNGVYLQMTKRRREFETLMQRLCAA